MICLAVHAYQKVQKFKVCNKECITSCLRQIIAINLPFWCYIMQIGLDFVDRPAARPLPTEIAAVHWTFNRKLEGSFFSSVLCQLPFLY